MTLVEILAKGWTHNHDEQAHGFVHRWAEKFQTSVDVKQCGDNSLRFTTELSAIRLRGMGEITCLLLGGEGAASAEALRDFRQRLGEGGGLPFVLATSLATFIQARETLPSGRFLLLSPEQLEQLGTSAQPLAQMKRWLREQIPSARLIPYNHLLSATGAMFFGRRHELDRLRDESELSIAIAGPARIGKTSLVKQYLYKLLRDHDPQVARTYYIDFYGCSKESRAVARFLAMKLDPSRRSQELSHTNLPAFLQYQRVRHHGPLNLLLDEVDTVCQSEAFSLLGEAAKLGYCRLVLVGRGELLRMMLYSGSHLRQRLQLLQLSPLEESAARTLLLDPLADLGFRLDAPERVVEQIFRLTGRLPHLMQFFARKLAELAIDQQLETITLAQVEHLKWDFETAQFFISPLQEIYLQDPEVRLIAFLLLKERPKEVTPGQVRSLAARLGVRLDEFRALRICNELVIHNVLIWNRGTYRLANEALVDYAQHLGILESTLESARRAVQAASGNVMARGKAR